MKNGIESAASFTRESGAEAVLDATRRLYMHGYNTTLSGNVSVRLPGNRILITPRALDKNRISASELALVGLSETKMKSIEGPLPSSEFRVHTHIYLAMPEVHAVVHPHGTYSLAVVEALGVKPFTKYLEGHDEEYSYYVGKFAWQPWQKAGTAEIADAVAEAIKKGATVVMMDQHGTVAIGKTMQEALGRAESLEKMAQRYFVTELLRKA